jgi:mono/diheme cytochrome c family protein
MKLLPLIAALPALLMLGSLAQTQTESENPVARGRALVTEFCGACHATGAKGPSPKGGALPLRTIGRTFDLDQFPRTLIRGISSDHPDMPQVKFSPQDARDVRDYLRTIQE